MEIAESDAHVVVLAFNVKGEDTVAPLLGVETVIACDVIEKPASANAAITNVFIIHP